MKTPKTRTTRDPSRRRAGAAGLALMADPTPGVSDGANSRPLNDTVAETGPGIPDDAVLEGQVGPGELAEGADAAVERLKQAGWTGEAVDDSEAHPS